MLDRQMVEQYLGKSTAVIIGGAEEEQLGHGGMVAVAKVVGNVVLGEAENSDMVRIAVIIEPGQLAKVDLQHGRKQRDLIDRLVDQIRISSRILSSEA